jgi:hypothetical protein
MIRVFRPLSSALESGSDPYRPLVAPETKAKKKKKKKKHV